MNNVKNKLLTIIKSVVVLVIIVTGVSGCAPATYQPGMMGSAMENESTLALLPNWYHEKVGYQLMGENQYPSNGTLAKLLKDADAAFMSQDLQACQILLARAQRINSSDAGVYVRLSYVFWVLDQMAQAEQMALRALAVMASDEQAKAEVQRLLVAIQSSQY